MAARSGSALKDHAMHKILLIPAILLAGCTAAPRHVNVGATGPWRVELSTRAMTDADFDGQRTVGMMTTGFCDHQDRVIRLSVDQSRAQLAADAMHELAHKIEREFPRVWVHLDAMDAPGFRCGADRLYYERAAIAAAKKAAGQ